VPVMTVSGELRRDALGVVLPHEHVFIDLRNQFTEPLDPAARERSHRPVTLGDAAELGRNPYALRDNLLLEDVGIAQRELDFFKRQGGATVVDCTSVGIGRAARKLRDVAGALGINIVAGSGYYTADTHPADFSALSVEAIADRMLSDLLVGIDGTEIKAGIYGEIGTSEPLAENEAKSLRAVGLAFRRHRAAVHVHTYPWGRNGIDSARILIDGGVDPAKIVIDHIDVDLRLDYLLELCALGVSVEFDDFGKEFKVAPGENAFAAGPFAQDSERVQTIGELIARGHGRKILITNDVCLKSMLRAYGGTGYAHILEHIVPMMRAHGIAPADIELMLRENPARVLCD
jgi:phosphotriesterase-related protein